MTPGDHKIFPTYKIRIDAQAITADMTTRSIATEISADLISIRTDRAILPNTPVKIFIELEDKVMLLGNVMWVLDTQTDEGEHYYLTGIRTDAIIHPKAKAIGRTEKSRLLHEMLYDIMEQSTN